MEPENLKNQPNERLLEEMECAENAHLSHMEKCLEVGELYLFHDSDPTCPAEGSLWGVLQESDCQRIKLESSSLDGHLFRLGGDLPTLYRYHRQASRSELRDYMYLLGHYEACYHHAK